MARSTAEADLAIEKQWRGTLQVGTLRGRRRREKLWRHFFLSFFPFCLFVVGLDGAAERKEQSSGADQRD